MTPKRHSEINRPLTVSVLPVPAGPKGEPPKLEFKAWVMVKKQRSVRGVVTRRS